MAKEPEKFCPHQGSFDCGSGRFWCGADEVCVILNMPCDYNTWSDIPTKGCAIANRVGKNADERGEFPLSPEAIAVGMYGMTTTVKTREEAREIMHAFVRHELKERKRNGTLPEA